MKNYILLFLCISFLFACTNDKKEKIREMEQCYKDPDIKYKYDSISFWFVEKYENINLKDAKITHIHDGKTVLLNYKTKQKDSKITIKNIENLVTKDTLNIFLSNKTNIKIYNFKNRPTYGGKNFLGCVLSEYTVNGKKRGDAMHGTLTIY